MFLSAKPAATGKHGDGRLEDDGAIPTLFHCECETCLTPLTIHVEHLGQRVLCPRCGHGFTAADPADGMSTADVDLQRRVRQFLRHRGVSGWQNVRVEPRGQAVVLRQLLYTRSRRSSGDRCAGN